MSEKYDQNETINRPKGLIVSAAIRTSQGLIYPGLSHCDIRIRFVNYDPEIEYCEDGFLTASGFFLRRSQAANYVVIIGQIDKNKVHTPLLSSYLWDQHGYLIPPDAERKQP